MDSRQKSAVLPAVVAAAMWAIIEAVMGALAPEVRPLVVGFHLVFWAGVASLVTLMVTGRAADLSVFNKNESLFLLLLGTGGYVFWLLHGLTFDLMPPATARLIFYTAPVLMALLSMFGSEAATGKKIALLVLGLLGTLLVLGVPEFGGTRAAWAAAGGWALCWAVFSLGLRRLDRTIEVLPAITIVLAGGAACMLASCIAGRINVFALTYQQLLLCAATGGIAGVGMFYCWTTALSRWSVAACAPLWYAAPLLGVGVQIWQGSGWPSWWTAGGVVVLAFVVRSAVRMAGEQSKTLGDVLRGE